MEPWLIGYWAIGVIVMLCFGQKLFPLRPTEVPKWAAGVHPSSYQKEKEWAQIGAILCTDVIMGLLWPLYLPTAIVMTWSPEKWEERKKKWQWQPKD
jgi:hypothetical protein